MDIVMLVNYHHDVRTTLTLDDDLAAKLKSAARRSGRPFRDVVNDTLRRGLVGAAISRARTPFSVQARDLGAVKAGLNLDNVAGVLEQVEGAWHR